MLSDTIMDNDLPEDKFLSSVADSRWLVHTRSALAGAILAAKYSQERNFNIVVHCSDGWDRTSQVVALAQILLDPFYRTIRGFAILIEKDWLSFGHKFQDRVGWLQGGSTDEQSPVFFQFL